MEGYENTGIIHLLCLDAYGTNITDEYLKVKVDQSCC